MIEIKGFISIDSLIDNTVNVVAPFGELSLYSRTYAKDRETHIGPGPAETEAVVFYADDGTSSVAIVQTHIDAMLNVGLWVSDNLKTSAFPTDKNGMVTMMRNALYTPTLTFLDIGAVITSNGVSGPDYVIWEDNGIRYTFWFADAAFRTQYPHFTIDVILPVEYTDDLMRPFSELLGLLKSPAIITQLANTLSNTATVSAFLMQEHMVQERNVADSEVLSYWGVNIYGGEGFSTDEQKAAIRAYILASTTYDVSVWSAVLPTIFVPNELYLIPAWDKVSIPNQTIYSGIYSPAIKITEQIRLVSKFSEGYLAPHVDAEAEMAPTMFKSLALLNIGADTNMDQKFSISELHPTYTTLNSHSLDYNRMAPAAQRFGRWVNSVLFIAENYTAGVTLPVGLSRVTRGTYDYLSGNVDGVDVLILTKESYMNSEGYDWTPNTNQYFTPGLSEEVVPGSITIASLYISIQGRLTVSGTVSKVSPGATVTLTITDTDINTIVRSVNIGADFTFVLENEDINLLKLGNITVSGDVTDVYGDVTNDSAVGLFEKPTGAYANLAGVYTTVSDVEYVQLSGDVTGVPATSIVQYTLTDKVNNIRSGSMSLTNDAFSNDSIRFDFPYRLVNGNIDVELRTLDVSGIVLTQSITVDSSVPAGVISNVVFDVVTGVVTGDVARIEDLRKINYTMTDSVGATTEGLISIASGAFVGPGVDIRQLFTPGTITVDLTVVDYSNVTVSATTSDTYIEYTPAVFNSPVGTYTVVTGVHTLALSGTIDNVAVNAVVSYTAASLDGTQNTAGSFNLVSGAMDTNGSIVLPFGVPVGEDINVSLSVIDQNGDTIVSNIAATLTV